MARQTQEERSRSTRAALMATARRLFTERGYANVSAAEIVAAAGVTRGALYHHYADKKALFQAVFVELEEEWTAELTAALGEPVDAASTMVKAIAVYLDSCERPEIAQIALIDAPAVLGWHEWRAIEAEHGVRMVSDLLTMAQQEGVLGPAPVRLLAQLVLSAVTEAALYIAHAEDKATAKEEARLGLLALLTGGTGGS